MEHARVVSLLERAAGARPPSNVVPRSFGEIYRRRVSYTRAHAEQKVAKRRANRRVLVAARSRVRLLYAHFLYTDRVFYVLRSGSARKRSRAI